jgi:hypothetical protein
MNNNLLQLKIKQRLNKLSSMDYDNIECWQVQEAFNKAQLEWVRRQLNGINLKREGAEQSVTKVDDLQVLLEEEPLNGFTYARYFESEQLPENYMRFIKVSARCQSDCCPDRKLTVNLIEEANADSYLTDVFSKPSFEWGETFCTMMGNRVRIYTDGQFTLVKPILSYYRKPKEVLFSSCVNPSTGEVSIKDQVCEFKDDIAEIIIDDACSILSGDIENMGQLQRLSQTAEKNN